MAKTYEPIATQTVSSATATVTFSSIASTYTDLILVVDGIVTANAVSFLTIGFNADTGTNYSVTRLSGDGTSALSNRNSASTAMSGGLISSTARFNNIIQIQNYSNATIYKTALFRANVSDAIVRASVGLWRNTAAINRIDVSALATTFAVGCTFTLYGIKSF